MTHWPKDEYGKFFKGDSYIILHTYKKPPSDVSAFLDVQSDLLVDHVFVIGLGNLIRLHIDNLPTATSDND